MNSLTNFGSDILEQIVPTRKAFEPLLRAHEAEILSFRCRTFKYGATDRHQLDVYYPYSTGSRKAPLLFFVYGGGYVSGAKVLDPPNELKHKNIGAFFAKQGFITVIADYRIFPNIRFPDPVIDIRDAFAWVMSNVAVVEHGMEIEADTSQVFFVAHSAGSTSVSTLMLLPGLLPASLRKRILGLVLMAGAYDFRGDPSAHAEMLRQYFGSTEDMRKNEPLGLLENASADVLADFPPVLAPIGEFDFPPLIVSQANFVPLLKLTITSPVEEIIMKGHNHCSPCNSLFSGEGEEWVFEVVDWMKRKLH